jgi:hypothetical protein
MSSESVDDVWCITDEQRDYYIRQFKLMQDDVRGVISGMYRLPILSDAIKKTANKFCNLGVTLL